MKDLTFPISNYLSFTRLEQKLLATPMLVVIALTSVIGMGVNLPLFDLDEGAFSEATREMLESGDWISTYLNGEPRHDKPILIYWCQALSVKLLGLNPIALRLPSMIAALAWIWVTYRFTAHFINLPTARLGIWILSSSWLATVIFKAATADALLNLLLCLIFFDIYRYLISPRPYRLAFVSTYMGLAFLTKGPIALVLPLLTTLLTLLISRKTTIFFRAIRHPFSWLPFILIVLPWHIAVYLDQGWAFYKGFYLGHNLERFNQTMESHGGFIGYYFILLPFVLAPFTRHATVLFTTFKYRQLDFSSLFLGLWFLVTLVLFSFSHTQLPHYLLYGLTPLFILLGRQISVAETNWIDIGIGWIWCMIVILFPYFLGIAEQTTRGIYDKAVLSQAHTIFLQEYQIIVGALLVLTTLLTSTNYISKRNRLLILSAITMININFVSAPLLAKARQLPVREAAEFALSFDNNSPVNRFVSYRTALPSYSVYLQRTVANVNSPQPGDLVFTKSSYKQALSNIAGAELVFQHGGILLIWIKRLNDE